MATKATDLLDTARTTWQQGTALIAALDAVGPGCSRTIMHAAVAAYGDVYTADDLAQGIAAGFNAGPNADHLPWLSQIEATDAQAAALRKAIGCLNDQQRAVRKARKAANIRVGGRLGALDYALSFACTTSWGQEERDQFFAERPDVAALYQEWYG